MANTLKRLVGPIILTGAAVTYYTTPGSTTTVIRDIQICNETGTAATFTLSIGADGAGKRLYKEFSIPANGFHSSQRQIVLAAAETLQAYSGTASALSLTISGVESV